MPNRLLLVVACMAFFACGCGTVSTFVQRPGEGATCRPLGGVREDVGALEQASEPGECLVAIIALIDMPLSFAADLVTLPWTVRAERLRKLQLQQTPLAPPLP